MYTVVLVDDEYWALKGLYDSYDWEANGFKVIARFTDPAQALDFITQSPPDIVFTDVCMDGLNGLELISTLRSERQIREFVVVSGHARFDYVQKSLRMGVFDYLLKPINRTELAALMDKLAARISSSKSAPAEDAVSEGADVPHETLNEILSYIRAHYAEPLTLSVLAKDFYLSETYVCDLFKKHVQKTFSAFLQETRLKQAKALLKNTNITISEVARRAGYPDMGYFCRVFRRVEDLSPMQYRRLQQEGSTSSTDV